MERKVAAMVAAILTAAVGSTVNKYEYYTFLHTIAKKKGVKTISKKTNKKLQTINVQFCFFCFLFLFKTSVII